MAENQKNDNQKQNDGPKRPFYMVVPDSTLGEFVKENPAGGYDVMVQIGLVNPQDKNTYTLVRFLNGNQMPGVITMDKSTTTYVFEKIKPASTGEIRVGLSLVSGKDESAGLSITVPRSKLQAPKTKTVSDRIKVQVDYPNPERVHQVHVKLFDESGKPESGKVQVVCSQNFKHDSQKYTGSHSFDVPETGIVVAIQPLQYNERFKFVAEANGSYVTEQLLGKKK